MPYPVRFFLLVLVGTAFRQHQAVIKYLLAENQTLREHLGDRKARFTPRQRRRLAESGKALGRALLLQYATLVTPDTILRWYRNLAAAKYTAKPLGRPRKREALAPLLLRLVEENPSFGYTRLRGVLFNLGYTPGRSTIKRVLDDHGVVPAPERDRQPSWRQFLATHWDGLAAGDFFHVEVMTWQGLVRYSVFFVMELRTRRVHIAGIRRDPDGHWLLQVARNLLDDLDGFLRSKTHLILDRDPLFMKAFKDLLGHSGAKVVTLPARSPILNSYVERFVRSIKDECLSRLVILGEAHLRHAIRNFVDHYHRERNHQGLDNALIDPGPEIGRQEGRVLCRPRLGGLLRHYYREAA